MSSFLLVLHLFESMSLISHWKFSKFFFQSSCIFLCRIHILQSNPNKIIPKTANCLKHIQSNFWRDQFLSNFLSYHYSSSSAEKTSHLEVAKLVPVSNAFKKTLIFVPSKFISKKLSSEKKRSVLPCYTYTILKKQIVYKKTQAE